MNLLFCYRQTHWEKWGGSKPHIDGGKLDTINNWLFASGRSEKSGRQLRLPLQDVENVSMAKCSKYDLIEGDSLYCLVSRLQHGVNHLHSLTIKGESNSQLDVILSHLNNVNVLNEPNRSVGLSSKSTIECEKPLVNAIDSSIGHSFSHRNPTKSLFLLLPNHNNHE